MEVDGKPGVVSRRNDRGRAHLPDPDKLFNAGLEGNARRAIDFFEGDRINARALKDLVRAAIEFNLSKLKKNAPASTRAKVRKSEEA
jgi:hypothetical protein